MLLTLGAAIVVLGVLIFVHELGHFLAAKSVGIAVLRFSFGLGPKTPLALRRGETEYCLSWIPFGGYVKMAGHEEEAGLEGPSGDAEVPRERAFDAKPLWARVWVISAGVLMNALFAVVVYALLAGVYGVARDPTTTVFEVKEDLLPIGAGTLATLRTGERIVRINGETMTGWADVEDALLTEARTPLRLEVTGRPQPLLVDVPLSDQEGRAQIVHAVVPLHEPVIGDVVPGYPAAEAGLRRGDRIVRVGADSLGAWERFVRVVEASADTPLPIAVLRDGRQLSFTVTPRAMAVSGEGGARRTVGRIGVSPLLPVEHYGPIGALGQGLRQAAQAGGLVLFTLKGLLTGQLSPRDLGGPILIGQLSGEAARLGLDVFLGFMALFSINLAVLNLLPIPVLDGGHLLFLAIEGVRRRPLSLQQRQKLTQAGMLVIVAIMLLALANDLTRLVRGLF